MTDKTTPQQFRDTLEELARLVVYSWGSIADSAAEAIAPILRR